MNDIDVLLGYYNWLKLLINKLIKVFLQFKFMY